MKPNVGTIDRLVRAVIGLVLLYLAFLAGMQVFDSATMKYGAAAAGIVMLLTAAFSYCPLYSRLGISTCKAN